MIKLKTLGLATVASAALLAGQALATPINSPFPGEDSLQQILDGITTAGPNCSDPADCHSSIDVNTDQVEPHAFWSVNSSGGSHSQIVMELTANDGINSFGIFNPVDGSTFELFGGADAAGASLTFGFDDSTGTTVVFKDVHLGESATADWAGGNNLFGFYLQSGATTWYSDASLNGDIERMVGFQGNGLDTIDLPGSLPGLFGSNEFVFGWEDGGDFDFQDFVVEAESVSPVPEPSVLAMFGLGLLGLGVSLRSRKRRG